MPSGASAMFGRPNRPLVVKVGYEGSSRRINFPAAATCRLESMRQRVEECFQLSAAPFGLSYTDDDGEEFSIRSEADLTEAISYFTSGEDDQALSVHSGHSGHPRIVLPAQKITIRLDVVVEYDGPSLSDTSSISSFRTGSASGSGSGEGDSEGSWEGSGYATSAASRNRGGLRDPFEEEGLTEYEATLDGRSTALLDRPLSRLTFNEPDTSALERYTGSRRTSNGNLHPNETWARAEINLRLPLTGPESDPAPPLLTQSELGSRWLREQSALTRRTIATGNRMNGSRQHDSDDDGDSDEESLGDLDLVKDDRGRYYYSYHSADTASMSGQSGTIPRSASPSLLLVRATDKSPSSPKFPAEPVLAPDCSACGMRLSYMRYVCQTCGEGDMWKENEAHKASSASHHRPFDSAASDGSSETEGGRASSEDSGTIYGHLRDRRESSSTHHSLQVATGSGSSPLRTQAAGARDWSASPRSSGYELCPACIEVHGVVHSKAAAKAAKRAAENGNPRSHMGGRLRHTFREKIWGAEGWQDVEYNEDTECTICGTTADSHRFKCVSCPRFNLCRTCYHKVEEIHPAHTFLSLPDTPVSHAAFLGAREGRAAPDDTSSKAMRHPGVFCHNCLQDIVGPRFHCAVCPSWDLCIQCEGSSTAASHGSGHTADHIMMKIPFPLATNEIDAVSRRARDRWFAQDSTAIANTGSRHRSPSPTNETVYAGPSRGPAPPTSAATRVTATDALDHRCRCSNCNEWIMGRRYQCANCPSKPHAYNLCSICELRSYRIHDPRHVFFKFDRPVDIPLASSRPILPLMYKNRVGDPPPGALTADVDSRDPTAYLKHVLHRETLCDIHSDQIRGVWLRCAHCASGFDICQDAEHFAEHDPTHIFILFKARVNMTVFRSLADLGSEHPRPLLRDRVYYS